MTDVLAAKSDINNKMNTKKKDKSNKENVDQEKKYDDESSKMNKKSSKKVSSDSNKPVVEAKTTSASSFFSISSSVPLTGVVAKKRASPVEEKETKKAKVTPIATAAPIPSFSFSIGPSFGGAVKAPSFTSTLPKPVAIEKKAPVTAKEKEVKVKASVSLIEKEEAMTDVIEEAKEEERVRSAVKKSASKPPAPQMAKRTPPKPAAVSVSSMTVATSPMPTAATPTVITSTIPNPSFLTQSTSLLTPIIPAPVTIRPSLQAPVASASALLADYQSTLELQRLLSQKDAAYELLSSKYAQLREAKKAEVNTLVDGVTKTAEQGSKSVAALVAHWKKEVAEAQEHADKVEKKMIDFPEKMHKIETEKMLEVAKNQAYEAEIDSLQQALNAETRKNAQLQEQMKDQQGLEKIIRAYLLLTSMQVNVKNNGWVNCRMINRADDRELSFDLDVDAEEEIEYAPQKIDLNGVNYPGWMTEGLFMQPDMAPRLLKLMLANVYKKEEEQ